MLFNFHNEINSDSLKKHGFLKQPFLLEPARKEEFFASNASSMLITGLGNTLKQSETEICLVKGEHGIGKTSLANYLHHSEQPYTSFMFSVQRKNNLSGMFRAIINDSEFESDDTQVLAKQAAIEIFHVLKNREQPVLFIDNAHLLREKTFLTLIRFTNAVKQQGVGKLKVVLFAEKTIEKIIDKIPDAQIRANDIYTVLMRPLNYTEIKRYLNHKSLIAGINELSINNKQLDSIATASSGIPSSINAQTVSLLNQNSKLKFLKNKNIQLGGYIAAAIVFIGLAFLYINNQENHSSPETTEQQPENLSLNNIDTDSSQPQEVIDMVLPQTEPDLETETIEPVNTLRISSEDVKVPELTDESETADLVLEADQVVSSKPPDKLETLKLEPSEVSTVNNTKPTTTTAIPEENTLFSHKWLLEQSPEHFVLQLLGTENYSSLVSFSQTVVTNCSLAYFRTVRNNSPWHVLLCGTYKSAEQATSDISNLPPSIRSYKPWPRNLATIQEKIRLQ